MQWKCRKSGKMWNSGSDNLDEVAYKRTDAAYYFKWFDLISNY